MLCRHVLYWWQVYLYVICLSVDGAGMLIAKSDIEDDDVLSGEGCKGYEIILSLTV